MKRALLAPLLGLLAACTGTQEPPLPALLALGGEGEVQLVKASSLQEGRLETVATWSKAGLLDLAYTQGRLFLLFPGRVEAYDTGGFSEASAPENLLAQKPLPDCTGGYLRLGENLLLIVCPSLPAAYAWPLTGGELTPVNLTGLDPSARLALGPGDRLAYASPSALGHRNLDGSDPKEKGVSTALSPKDLVYDRDAERLWALYGGTFESRLFRLDRDLNLSDRGFQTPYTALALGRSALVALGQGFQGMDAEGTPTSAPQSPSTSYRAGLVALDGYLYLVQGSVLEVWDLLSRPLLRTATLSLPGFLPKSLAYIPVQ